MGPETLCQHGGRGWWQIVLHRKEATSIRKRWPLGFCLAAAELITPSQWREKLEHCICIETSATWRVQNYSSIYVLWIVLISSSAVPVFSFVFSFLPSLTLRKHLNQISATFCLLETWSYSPCSLPHHDETLNVFFNVHFGGFHSLSLTYAQNECDLLVSEEPQTSEILAFTSCYPSGFSFMLWLRRNPILYLSSPYEEKKKQNG